MDQFETKHVPKHMYKFEYTSNQNVYFCPNGIHLLTYVNRQGQTVVSHTNIYTWDDFKIVHYYYQKQNKKGINKKYSFILNETPFFNKSWNDLLRIVQDYACDTPSKKNLIINVLRQYIDKEKIVELQIADIIGFTVENGWQLPDKYNFVSGNSFREDIENNILNLCEYEIPDDIDIPSLVRNIYNLTTIDNKDYIFAYGFVAPFLYSLRHTSKLMPLLALGGPGGKGKTAIEELLTVKMWGNIPEIIGSALMDSKPRVQGTLTGSTLPVCIDDCEDLKDFITSIFKRYTTTSERVKKLNPDQTTKMDCEYCSPAMMTFNALPIMFDDVQFRQRVIMLYISQVIENEGWVEVYNDIPDMSIGKWVINHTIDMTYVDLVKLYKAQDSMGLKKNRQKAMARILNLGKYFAKKWFNIDLNLERIPQILTESLMAGNELLIDLVIGQIDESKNFEHGGNINRRSWVLYPVLDYEYNGVEGYLYTTENCIDLAKRSGKTQRSLSLKNVALILETQWDKIKEGAFYYEGTTKRGIFIPKTEVDKPIDVSVDLKTYQSKSDDELRKIEMEIENAI